MKRNLIVLALAAVMVIASAGAAYAGEVTGNGKSLHQDGDGLHGHSACAYSGQEDLQFFEGDEGEVPKAGGPTKGDPGHAQSWGQAKEAWDFLISIGLHPSIACNPTTGGGDH